MKLIFTLEEYFYRYSIDGRQNHRKNFDGATIDILTALSILRYCANSTLLLCTLTAVIKNELLFHSRYTLLFSNGFFFI